MKLSKTRRTFPAIALALGLAALLPFAGAAQSSGASGAATAASQDRTAQDQTVTVTGCVQREEDYRKARDAGRGGVAGTGVGAGNEFVLANAMMASASPSGAAGKTPGGTPETTGAAGTAFELTGSNEGQAAQFVGKRVEIAGKLKAAEVAPSGKPTGGATAGRPPEGIDLAGKDLKLRELEITSIKEVTGSCPSM
jgi:hypothetical protein